MTGNSGTDHTAADIYGAATVLIAARTLPDVRSTISLENIDESIDQALTSLSAQEAYTTLARQCRKALEALQDQIIANRNVLPTENSMTRGINSHNEGSEAQAQDSFPLTDENQEWTIFDGMDAFWFDETLFGQELSS
jgi:hypothetical protein